MREVEERGVERERGVIKERERKGKKEGKGGMVKKQNKFVHSSTHLENASHGILKSSRLLVFSSPHDRNLFCQSSRGPLRFLVLC